MSIEIIIRSSVEGFLVFETQKQENDISVKYENETLWMTQKSIAIKSRLNV